MPLPALALTFLFMIIHTKAEIIHTKGYDYNIGLYKNINKIKTKNYKITLEKKLIK